MGPKVVASPPKIKPKSTISNFEKFFFDIRGAISGHPYLSVGFLAGILIGVAMWSKGRLRGVEVVSSDWMRRMGCWEDRQVGRWIRLNEDAECNEETVRQVNLYYSGLGSSYVILHWVYGCWNSICVV